MSELKKKRAPKDHVTDAHGNFILKEESVKVGTKYYHKDSVVLINGNYYEKDDSIMKCAITGQVLKIGVNSITVFNHKFEKVYILNTISANMTFPHVKITETTLNNILIQQGTNVSNFKNQDRALISITNNKSGEYILDSLGIHGTLLRCQEYYGSASTINVRSRLTPNDTQYIIGMYMLNLDEVHKAGFIPFFSSRECINYIHKEDAKYCKILPRELYLKPYNYSATNSSSNYQFNNIVSSLVKSLTLHGTGDNQILDKLKTSVGVKSSTFFRTGGLPYTFGVEIETSSGTIKAIASDLNCSAVRDGSIGSGEYVTGVLKGDAGVKHLKKICDRLYYNTAVDNRCGVHVHVGGLNLNKEFFIYAHLLGLKLQDNIFNNFLPNDRKNNNYCKRYPKNIICTDTELKGSYNKLYEAVIKRTEGHNLEKLGEVFNDVLSTDFINIYNKYSKEDYQMYIDEMYKILYLLLAQGKKLSSDNNKNFQHPGGRYAGGSGSSINYRYFWLNFISAAFNQRDNKDAYTIEFRCFGGTTNFYSIYAWLLICMAFCSYVENNKADIVNKGTITIKDILEAVYGKAKNTFLYSALMNYVNFRESSNFDSEVITFPIRNIQSEIDNKTALSQDYKIIESVFKSDIESDELKYNPNSISAISELINFFHLNLKK